MDIKNLETFRMVAELKNFTHAAQTLGYTQSTVSFQIKQLEEELGAPLFERMGKNVTLTNEGENLLPICLNILKLNAQAHHIAGRGGEPSGTVRIAIAASLSQWQLSSWFKIFHEQYPQIHLIIIAASTNDMFQMLDQNQVDFVYTLDRRISNSKYVVAIEAPVSIHFVTYPNHPLAKKNQVNIEDIMESDLILTEKEMSYRALLDEQLAKNGIETKPLLEVGNTNLICELLHQEIGISFLPDFVTETACKSNELLRLEIPDFEIKIWRQLLYHRNKWISPAVQCVMDALQQM